MVMKIMKKDLEQKEKKEHVSLCDFSEAFLVVCTLY